MTFILPLLYFSYTLCFWGATLIGGGPQGTGSWPFLYTLTGLGPGPQTPSQQPGGTQTTTPPGNSVIPGQSNFPSNLPIGIGGVTGPGFQPPPCDPASAPWYLRIWCTSGTGGFGQVDESCMNQYGYKCDPATKKWVPA